MAGSGDVAWVSGSPITAQEFQRSYRVQEQQYRQQLGGQFSPALMRRRLPSPGAPGGPQAEALRKVEKEAGKKIGQMELAEVREHLTDTYFAWMGEHGDDSVFYYRVHSPVILIEFDHQTPVALPGPKVPNRQHIHTAVRTPNGNDYGKDLLRQHHAAQKH